VHVHAWGMRVVCVYVCLRCDRAWCGTTDGGMQATALKGLRFPPRAQPCHWTATLRLLCCSLFFACACVYCIFFFQSLIASLMARMVYLLVCVCVLLPCLPSPLPTSLCPFLCLSLGRSPSCAEQIVWHVVCHWLVERSCVAFVACSMCLSFMLQSQCFSPLRALLFSLFSVVFLPLHSTPPPSFLSSTLHMYQHCSGCLIVCDCIRFLSLLPLRAQ